MHSFNSEKSLYLTLSNHNIEDKDQIYQDDPLRDLKKNETNHYGDGYEDDIFKIPRDNLPKGVIVKRLKDIFQLGSSIRQLKYIIPPEPLPFSPINLPSKPTYLSQLKMIPEKHFAYLIEPTVINQKGYYHIAAVKEGRIIKKTVDDFVYYDTVTKRVHVHPFLEDKPWIHIILKVWAKIHRDYDKMQKAKPFQFIKAFTYPDWSVMNPTLEDIHTLILMFGHTSKKQYIYICKTKSDPKVGAFGLIPDCSSYIITGYYQEYGNIFIRLKSYVGDKWNGKCCQKKVDPPTQELHLGQDQFIMPIQQFLNVYHLIYYTNNKYTFKTKVYYNKYTISLDARDSKAKMLNIEVQGEKNVQQSVNINLFFPNIVAYDLSNKRNVPNEEHVIPKSKILLGRQMQGQAGAQSNYADSIRQKMLKNQDGFLVALSNHKIQYIRGNYVRGYSNQITYHLRLKPGCYILRLKVQKLLPQYRVLLNTVSSSQVCFSQNKNQDHENQFLAQILSSKAREEEQSPIYPTPTKKQTWILMNNDFEELGYGSILFQVGKNDNRGLTIIINPEKIKKSGYRLKNLDTLRQSNYRMYLKERQSNILIMKYDQDWKGDERTWPPEGIDMKFDNLPQKLQSAVRL